MIPGRSCSHMVPSTRHNLVRHNIQQNNHIGTLDLILPNLEYFVSLCIIRFGGCFPPRPRPPQRYVTSNAAIYSGTITAELISVIFGTGATVDHCVFSVEYIQRDVRNIIKSAVP